MPVETKVIFDRVKDFGPTPKSPFAALRQAHDLLAEEGRWTTGELFEDGDPEEVYEASFCGNWSACALGAIGMVTGDLKIKVRKEWYDVDEEEAVGFWLDSIRYQDNREGFAEWWAKNRSDYESVSYEWVQDDLTGDRDTVTFAAARVLALAIAENFGEQNEDGEYRYMHNDPVTDPFSVIFMFNDADQSPLNRTRVLEAFKAGMKRAKSRRPLPWKK